MPDMEQILTNAKLVLPDEIVEGTLVVRDGVIVEAQPGPSALGEDMAGDYILPGLVELHTDHLENHYGPRPGVRWDVMSALQSHDAQIATSGITTVFDCLRMGTDEESSWQPGEMRILADALDRAQSQGRLRSEHRLHLRCEVSSPDVVDEFSAFEGMKSVGLASLMDHAPGQRQFVTMDQFTLYYKTNRGLSDEEFERFVAERIARSEKYSRKNRMDIALACKQQGIAIASHDDATLAHVAEAVRDGVAVAEFPTSVEAARASHDAGMSVLMGAPNVVRGKSHSGNIAAHDLARAGLLDVLSSDYVPLSLIHAPFCLADEIDEISLPAAIAMVTKTPAETVGLDDRGAIMSGKRADLVRVSRHDLQVPVVRSVWRGGRRIA